MYLVGEWFRLAHRGQLDPLVDLVQRELDYASSFSPRSIRAVLGEVTSTTTHGFRATMSDSATGAQMIATSG